MYVVRASGSRILPVAVSDQTVRPCPIDVLHSAAGLLRHDLLAACILETPKGCRVAVECMRLGRVVGPPFTCTVGDRQVEAG